MCVSKNRTSRKLENNCNVQNPEGKVKDLNSSVVSAATTEEGNENHLGNDLGRKEYFRASVYCRYFVKI